MADTNAGVQDSAEYVKPVVTTELCRGKCSVARQLCHGNGETELAASTFVGFLKTHEHHLSIPSPQISLPTVVCTSSLDDFWNVPPIDSAPGCRKCDVRDPQAITDDSKISSLCAESNQLSSRSSSSCDDHDFVDQKMLLWELDLYTDESELSEEEQSLASSSKTSVTVIRDSSASRSSAVGTADVVDGERSLRQSPVNRVADWTRLQVYEGVPQNHLPPWLQDNDFLVDGHRPPLNSYLACCRSLFQLHTETLNIWTHLIGCMLFIVLAIRCLMRHDICWQEKAVLCAYLTSIVTCFWSSCSFHIFLCHSKEVGYFFCSLDYCGIIVMITSSTTPWIYYAFHCRPVSQLVYTSLTVAMATTCLAIIFFLFEQFTKPTAQKYRASLFVALSLTGSLPAIHYTSLVGMYAVLTNLSLILLFAGLLTYLVGVLVYVTRFPECKWPGKFDLLFSSHQLFHVLTILGAYVNYIGLCLAANNRLEFGGCYQIM